MLLIVNTPTLTQVFTVCRIQFLQSHLELSRIRLSREVSEMGNSESQQLRNDIGAKSGYYFRDNKLLLAALTHDSLRADDPSIPTYQRLEFLGDSVLQFIITNYLFQKHPQDDEGQLSQRRAYLVSRSYLETIAKKLELEIYAKVGDSVKQQRQDSKFKRYDSFVESLLGAVFLDAGANGLDAAKAWVFKL